MWPNIRTYIAGCEVCQRHKYETLSPVRLLQPLPVPDCIWSKLSMDFIDALPNSRGYTMIMVVVDRLSKAAHFVALKDPYTVASVARAFMDNIIKLHGLQKSIVSYSNRIFTSKFWQELFHLQGTKLKLSFGYHPQTDGQTEVVNRCLKTYLWCFVSTQPKQWVQWLSWAEYWYNTTYHTSTKMTPFEVVYGQPPPTMVGYETGTTTVAQVDETLSSWDSILRALKQHLTEAQNRMKQQMDQHRTEHEFAVGDLVFLRLQSYRQSLIATHRSMKLAPRFYGPFHILNRVGKVAIAWSSPQARLSTQCFMFHASKKS
jgi:hypothetical protein